MILDCGSPDVGRQCVNQVSRIPQQNRTIPSYMAISPRIIPPVFRPTFRSECHKPFLGLLVLLALVTTPLLPVSAQSNNYKEPDYSKFKVEDGQITLEVWSWVVGLDQVVKEFEQAFPNIKVHVNNVGGGPAEYQKLQTVLKAGSGAPDVVQIEYDFSALIYRNRWLG